MHLAVLILLVFLLAAAVACATYYSAIIYHIVRTAVRVPSAAAGLRLPEAAPGPDVGSNGKADSAAAAPSVCVIIPAHNEEASIADLARSLKAQDYPRFHVVFCLDRCTDGTEAILREELGEGFGPSPAAEGTDGDAADSRVGGEPRFTILNIASCPSDWAGKVHAIHRGVSDVPAAQEADYLLFADADTRFHPACIRATVALLRHRGLGMLSLLSTLDVQAWFERLAQPAAALELLRQYPLTRANHPTRPRAFANGQFILFARSAYERVGGHAAARHALLEDIELARLCAKAKIPIGLFPAGEMLRCRMYESWPQFRRGWKRIYTEAANRRPARLARSAGRLRLIGVALPAASGAAIATGVLALDMHGALAAAAASAGAAGVVIFAGAITAFVVRAGASPIIALLYPIGAWLTAGILAEAARDLREGTPTQWAGRSYVREAR